jgi:hypothetical protein
MLPAGKRGGLMREAAQADGVAGRTLVQARIEDWDERHPFPAARVRTALRPLSVRQHGPLHQKNVDRPKLTRRHLPSCKCGSPLC